jgi:hypothetical protein
MPAADPLDPMAGHSMWRPIEVAIAHFGFERPTRTNVPQAYTELLRGQSLTGLVGLEGRTLQ